MSRERTPARPLHDETLPARPSSDGSLDAARAVPDGPGRPLDPGTRTAMEARFGHDFSRVRVHTDARAATLGAAHDALALTVGSDIAVAPGAPPLATAPGRLLLAHELAHVAQNQRASAGPAAPGRTLEREAARASVRVLAGRPARVTQAGDGTPRALGRFWRYLLTGLAGAAAGGLLGLGLSAIGVFGGAGILASAAGGLGLGLFVQNRREAGARERQELLAQRRQIDRWIDGAHGNDLPDQVTPDQAEQARWRVASDRAFRFAYEAMGWTDLAWFQVGGFVDRTTRPPTIWIRNRHNDPYVRLHEAMHLYSHPVIRTQPPNLREGATDFFSRRIAQAQGIRITGEYERQFRVIERLVAIVGEAPVRRAFFRGDVPGLVQAAQAAGLNWNRDILQGDLANQPAPRRGRRAPRPAPQPGP